MSSITYLLTGASFMTIGAGEDEADVSVPALANSLKDALQQVRLSYEFEHVEVERIELMRLGKDRTLLAVYTELGDRSGEPLLLVYDGELVWDVDLDHRIKNTDGATLIRHIVAARHGGHVSSEDAGKLLQLVSKESLVDALLDCVARGEGSRALFCDADSLVDGQQSMFAPAAEAEEVSHG
jgi:hypothetical protein